MINTSDRIKEGMKLRNLRQTDLCQRTGITKGAMSSYISGRYVPKQNNIYLIAKALNVSEAWLMGSNVPIERTLDKCNCKTRIPVLGSVPAGIPIEAIQDIVDYEEIDADTAAKGEYFALKIKGDSMEPRICEGDVVIVRKQDDVESGDIAIVMVNGNDATIKRLLKYQDGIRLMPSNPSYDPIYFTNQEIENKPVRIIGKVVENRQKY